MPVFLVVENGRKSRCLDKGAAHSAPGIADGKHRRAVWRLSGFDRERAAFVVHGFERIEDEVFDHFFDLAPRRQVQTGSAAVA